MRECECLLNAASRTTGCECDAPGFCKRHRCNKPQHIHMLCRTHIHYFILWERGEGPCIENAGERPTIGLGDVAAWLIRVASFGRARPGPNCRCSARREWLNRTFPLWPFLR